MLQSTELEIKLSELRTELRGLQAKLRLRMTRPRKSAPRMTGRSPTAWQSLDDLETQKRTALKAEEVAQERALKLVNVEQRVGAGDIPTMPAEFREFMGIEAQVLARWVLRRRIHDTMHDEVGAELEMRQALGVERTRRDSVADVDRAQAAAGDSSRAARRARRGREVSGRLSARSSPTRLARGTTCVPAGRVRVRHDGHERCRTR